MSVLGTLSIAEVMRQYREDLGLDQAAMAKRVGITKAHYARLESGKCKNPRMRTIFYLLQDKVLTIEAKTTCPNRPDHFHVAKIEDHSNG